jgi:hypothetical protein
MCTVTLEHAGSRLVATMNRDEALARGPETPPAVTKHANLEWMAPRDSDKGGTWAGVNTRGVFACLLNAYLPGESLLPDTSGRFRSRGEIIPRILESGGLQAGLDYLETMLEPSDYPSFTLIVGDSDRQFEYQWLRKGGLASRELEGRWNLWSSSGWDSTEVKAWREHRFQRWLDDGEEHLDSLPSFHLIREPGHEERSPLMQRSWSATRSITQLRVDAASDEVELRYWPQPTPESGPPSTSLVRPLIHETAEEPADAKAP